MKCARVAVSYCLCENSQEERIHKRHKCETGFNATSLLYPIQQRKAEAMDESTPLVHLNGLEQHFSICVKQRQ